MWIVYGIFYGRFWNSSDKPRYFPSQCKIYVDPQNQLVASFLITILYIGLLTSEFCGVCYDLDDLANFEDDSDLDEQEYAKKESKQSLLCARRKALESEFDIAIKWRSLHLKKFWRNANGRNFLTEILSKLTNPSVSHSREYEEWLFSQWLLISLNFFL